MRLGIAAPRRPGTRSEAHGPRPGLAGPSAPAVHRPGCVGSLRPGCGSPGGLAGGNSPEQSSRGGGRCRHRTRPAGPPRSRGAFQCRFMLFPCHVRNARTRVCTCMCAHEHTSTYAHTNAHACASCTRARVDGCVYGRVCRHMCTCMCACVHAWLHMCVHACVHACMCTHTHTIALCAPRPRGQGHPTPTQLLNSLGELSGGPACLPLAQRP